MEEQIGVGVIIINDEGKVLLGKRLSKHGHGTWSFPGGHLEKEETILECARREAEEETGLKLSEIELGPSTRDIFEESGKVYLTHFVIARCFEGTPKVMEPDKCESWHWFDWDQLPSPLFKPIESLMNARAWKPPTHLYSL
ncbi:MAG: NUDIX domain-containing protein [Gammaproteobacteria bacterium]|nr:NUDIX domain-containing protein [Gammaproteobacteria bacterium]